MGLKVSLNTQAVAPHATRLAPYTILSDEDIEIGGLSDFNYWWHAVVGGAGEGGAGVGGAAPVGPTGGSLREGFGGRSPPTGTKRT